MHELDVPVLDVIVSGLLFHDLVLGRRPHRPLTERVAGQGEGGRQRRVRRRRLGPTEQWDPAVLDHLEHCDVFLPNTDEAMLYRLPQLRPIVLFTVVMSTIGGLQTFAEPRVMVGNGGGTGQSGMTVVLFFYRAGFLANDYGYAAAIALGIGALVLLFTAINWRIFRGRGEDALPAMIPLVIVFGVFASSSRERQKVPSAAEYGDRSLRP